MLNLLRVDFRRALKDKLFTAVCIIAVIFAIVTPLLYVLIFSGLSGETGDMGDMLAQMGIGLTAKQQFFTSFSLSNNLGLVLPVLLGIIMWKDFSHGTIRNKIISGNTRPSIFLSMFIVSFTLFFGVMLFGATISLLVSLPFFPFDTDPFTISDLGYFFTSLLIELLTSAFVAALVSFLCASMKNVGLVIVSYIAIAMVMSVVTSILSIGGMLLLSGAVEGGEKIGEFLNTLQKLNVFNYGTLIGGGSEYETADLLCYLLSPALSSASLVLLGIFNFARKYIK